ncbi:hypothetical protein Naga_100116g5 [Nannochloropsis gaditana]|uniref:Uncharacterized protein n=1 Tax=Nannochloropsis gaditana TaxID=72520 RepID=W7TWC4_9STRA|nr:hypothetical protein Naga_100116g5 [Nannochloropsis gaditana]
MRGHIRQVALPTLMKDILAGIRSSKRKQEKTAVDGEIARGVVAVNATVVPIDAHSGLLQTITPEVKDILTRLSASSCGRDAPESLTSLTVYGKLSLRRPADGTPPPSSHDLLLLSALHLLHAQSLTKFPSR